MRQIVSRPMRLFGILPLLALLLVVSCGAPNEIAQNEQAQNERARLESIAPPTQTELALNPPTPTLPPLPAPELFTRAMAFRHIGDYEAAAVDFTSVIHTYPDMPEADRSHFFLAESFALRGRWQSAVAALQDFVATHELRDEQTPQTARALFWLARSYEELGQWRNAATTYERYRALNTPLAPYATLRQAAQHEVLGELERAAELYTLAAASDIQPGERAGSYEKAIRLRQQLGQSAAALELYRELIELAELPDYRARILREAAALAEAQGQPDQALLWLNEAAAIEPFNDGSIAALRELLEENKLTLPAAQTARLLYVSGNYEQALSQFDRALQETTPDSDEALDLRRLRAMSVRELDDYERALQELEQIANVSPNSEPGRQARLDWIQTLGQSGNVAEAARWYYDYASMYSDDWRAPEALDRSAQLQDRLNNRVEAMALRLELGQRYPQSEQAVPALRQAAWYYYNRNDLNNARAAWEALSQHTEPYERARGSFWAARITRSQGDTERAQALFQQAQQAAPNTYYSTRAAEELGITYSGTVPVGAPTTADDWQALTDWVLTWSPPADGAVDIPALLTKLREHVTIQRAIELREVGLHVDAIAEWNHARTFWGNDPLRLMLVARLAHEQTVPYVALKAAAQLADLAPTESSPPPLTLERLRYPTPYPELVIPESQVRSLDPRLFYALVRQESLFNVNATSWVGARGMAQVMPTTGEGIAQDLGVQDFHIDQLYRPHVSVRFGTFYIGQRIRDMEGSIHGALAAYNGGLGNAQRWANGSYVVDEDLFTEYIDYPETEEYVKRVYGFYGAYQRIYSLPTPATE